MAAQMLGWDNLFHCEINDFCRKILQYWFPKSESYEDIRKTDFRIWKGKIDVLSGGFPCQPFSYAGKRRGQNDDRYLWPEMLRAIEECWPRWVVGENVAGITTMVEQGDVVKLACQASVFGEDDGVQLYGSRAPFTIQRVCKDLEKIGYTVQPVVIPACAVGAPHRRDRVFIVAHREELQRDGSKPGERGRRKEVSELGDNNSKGISAADTFDERLQRWHDGYQERYGESPYGCIGLDNKTCCRAISGEGRWDFFPTVSPVHRGNDGIPFPVDRLAVPPIPGPPTYGKGDRQRYPFSKWRTESLKAYGNAIVPQVMYEIFRFIQILEEGGEK